MIPDPEVWFQRRPDGPWYKYGGKHPHVVKVCAYCGADYLGQRSAKFCSAVCASGGDGKSYGWAHMCVQRKRGQATDHACVDCGSCAAEWPYGRLDACELTGPSGERYSLDPDHYQPRCKRCHVRFDGHIGEGNGRAKLTDAQCREIQLSVGLTQQELADRFGVSQGHISAIRRGRRSHVVVSHEVKCDAEEYLRQMEAGNA